MQPIDGRGALSRFFPRDAGPGPDTLRDVADQDAAARPEERARRVSRRTRQNLAVAAITLIVPITVALVLLAESEAGLARIAFFNLHHTEPRGALAVGFALGFALAATAALARFVSQRRAPAALVCLPPALLATITLAAGAAWLPDPLALAPDLGFGERARAAAFALTIRAALYDAGLLASALSLGIAALALRPGRATASINKDKRPFFALAVAALSLPGAALLARHVGQEDLGRDAVASWVAALPAGMGLVAVVLGASRTNRGDGYAATRLLAAACAGLGGVLLAALAPAMGEVVAVSTTGMSLDAFSTAAGGIRRMSLAHATSGATFALPILLTTLVAMPPRGLGVALSRVRPALLVTLLLALAPALFVLPTSAALRHVESLANDQRRLAANPGVSLADASLPAGTLVVDLARAFTTDLEPDLVPTKPTRIVLDTRAPAPRWEEGAPVRFDGLGEGTHELHLDGPYLGPTLRVSMPDPRVGARILVPAIPLAPPLLGPAEPIEPLAPLAPPPGVLDVDATSPDAFVVAWRVRDVAKASRRVPRVAAPADVLRYSTLSAAVQEIWKEHGSHRDPLDRNRDRALIRMKPGASLEEAHAVVAAVLSLERTIRTHQHEPRLVPVFDVTVAEPLPPPPPPAEPPAEPTPAPAIPPDPTGAP